MILKGKVVAGCNHFQPRIKNNSLVFEQYLGRELHPGTINVLIDFFLAIKYEIKIPKGIIVDDNSCPDQEYLLEKCTINGFDAFRIRPYNITNGLGGHGDNKLEICSPHFIPDAGINSIVELQFDRDE